MNAALAMVASEEAGTIEDFPIAAAPERQVRIIRLASPRAAALIYAENRLFPWAKWARENRERLGVPTVSLLYKAMQSKSIPAGKVRSKLVELHIAAGARMTARGKETRSFRPTTIGEVPEPITDVDCAVGALPPDLRTVLIADFFTYGPIEVRCLRTRWKRARYSQLLEAAKYAVYAYLMAKTPGTSLDD